MKKFEEPEINFVEIDSDIITTSLCPAQGGNDLPFQP